MIHFWNSVWQFSDHFQLSIWHSLRKIISFTSHCITIVLLQQHATTKMVQSASFGDKPIPSNWYIFLPAISSFFAKKMQLYALQHTNVDAAAACNNIWKRTTCILFQINTKNVFLIINSSLLTFFEKKLSFLGFAAYLTNDAANCSNKWKITGQELFMRKNIFWGFHFCRKTFCCNFFKVPPNMGLYYRIYELDMNWSN